MHIQGMCINRGYGEPESPSSLPEYEKTRSGFLYYRAKLALKREIEFFYNKSRFKGKVA